MARTRYSVGDKVDVSRAETGEDHERAVVVDAYELIIGEERRPMVVVEFDDGERKYMTAATPNVLPVYDEPDEAPAEAAEPEAEAAEPEAEAAVPEDEAVEGDDDELFVDDDEGASP